jgi:hypothetical protein
MPMSDHSLVTIALLGGAHGVNPAMGWLFAVSLGFQAQSGRAVWRALGPLALGHALAIGGVLSAAAVVGAAMPVWWLRWITALALLAVGVRHLRGHVHAPRAGMRVGAKELTTWSFLMASAHGAGLMVLPFVLGRSPAGVDAPHRHGSMMLNEAHSSSVSLAGLSVGSGDSFAFIATLVHTASYLVVACAIAWLVYNKLGVRVLRTAWINLNVIWASALIVTAACTLLL